MVRYYRWSLLNFFFIWIEKLLVFKGIINGIRGILFCFLVNVRFGLGVFYFKLEKRK